jgi:hypothetical protein
LYLACVLLEDLIVRMSQEKDVNILKDIIKQLAELDKIVKNRLRLFLKGKEKEDMKKILRELDKSSLHVLCEMSLPDEDYEICQAVHEVLAEHTSESK